MSVLIHAGTGTGGGLGPPRQPLLPPPCCTSRDPSCLGAAAQKFNKIEQCRTCCMILSCGRGHRCQGDPVTAISGEMLPGLARGFPWGSGVSPACILSPISSHPSCRAAGLPQPPPPLVGASPGSSRLITRMLVTLGPPSQGSWSPWDPPARAAGLPLLPFHHPQAGAAVPAAARPHVPGEGGQASPQQLVLRGRTTGSDVGRGLWDMIYAPSQQPQTVSAPGSQGSGMTCGNVHAGAGRCWHPSPWDAAAAAPANQALAGQHSSTQAALGWRRVSLCRSQLLRLPCETEKGPEIAEPGQSRTPPA